MYLNDAIAEYLVYREGAGFRKNTVRVSKQGLDALLASLGNLNMRSLEPVHGERFYAYLGGRGLAPRTVNTYLTAASTFFKWCRLRRYLPPASNPMGTVRQARVEVQPRRRVPAAEFDRLLDSAPTPQARMVVALGLYLFLRSSEVISLSVGDVHFDLQEIVVYQPKTGRTDEMPICEELDYELHRWLGFYTLNVGQPLQDTWPLVPPWTAVRFLPGNDGKSAPQSLDVLNPRRRLTQPQRPVQRTLEAFGWEVEKGEGGHTLRRSGARAYFEDMIATGEVRDGVLREVSAMLHHKSVVVTEIYLGLEADKERRNTRIKGRRMYHTDRRNVTPLQTLAAVDEVLGSEQEAPSALSALG